MTSSNASNQISLESVETARNQGIEHFMISFTDLLGVHRSKLIPVRALDQLTGGQGHDLGVAQIFGLGPTSSDIFARISDASQCIRLPWEPSIVWAPVDLYVDGEPLNRSPRWALKNQVAKAKELGYVMKSGVEVEFILMELEGKKCADQNFVQGLPFHDAQRLYRRREFLTKILKYTEELGWEPYGLVAEGNYGQFELNYGFYDALTTADRHLFFKFMVKEIARECGYRATFMPRPLHTVCNNGCHVHVSLWDSSNKNLFPKETGLSEIAHQFIGGVLKHAQASMAFVAPTVNSYKRVNSKEWCPFTVSYSGNNRCHLIRIPDKERIEIRHPDTSADPYLLQATILASGLDGIRNAIDPGPPRFDNLFDSKIKDHGLPLLPTNLKEALTALKQDVYFTEQFGEPLVDAFLDTKTREWGEYSQVLTDWELNHYLDC
ncbi:unnamed protein product [Owenia fusiformis]|uniref:GS catalytic domain-containing protein n=1 Tax=Owenia fusiformis TaxID=6347 RepID=A0A8S4N8P1_OWEFU|nr:unnamed protein product [Owenia fusiformis]